MATTTELLQSIASAAIELQRIDSDLFPDSANAALYDVDEELYALLMYFGRWQP